VDVTWRKKVKNWLSPEFETTFQKEVAVFWRYKNSLINHPGYAFVPKDYKTKNIKTEM